MTSDRNSELVSRAKKLRRDMTPHERKLWYLFLRSYPIKFYRQRVMESYIVDFYCASARLVIELDGSQHYEDTDKAYDARRTAALQRHGFMVLRFTNREIDREFQAVCQRIDEVVRNRFGGTPPVRRLRRTTSPL